MSEKKLRIGIIGMGWYAATDHVPQLRATGRAEIVAVSRRDPQRLALAQRELAIPQGFSDWREMLEKTELDAIVISTPHNYHLEPALAAMERGLHVLIEKPLATTIADARAILQASKQTDRVVMMGVNRRGEPSWQTSQRALSSGQIGQVRQINTIVYLDNRIYREGLPIAPPILQSIESGSEMMKTFTLDVPSPDSWRRDPIQMGGDFFADVGSHLVDAMLWFGGAPAREVMAYQPKNRSRQASILTLQALLSNDITLSITFNDNVALGDEYTFGGGGSLNVLGDRGRLTASIGWGGGGPMNNLSIEQNGKMSPVVIEGKQVHPATAFISSILDGAPNIAPVQDAANVVCLIQSAYQSAAENRLVQIEEM